MKHRFVGEVLITDGEYMDRIGTLLGFRLSDAHYLIRFTTFKSFGEGYSTEDVWIDENHIEEFTANS